MTANFTLFHNPNCSTSRAALDATKVSHLDVDVVQYLKAPLEAQALRDLIEVLEDPVTDLVRRDKRFKELGLVDADVADADRVVAVLVEHPALMQRPILVKHDGATWTKAVIGRPKERIPALLES